METQTFQTAHLPLSDVLLPDDVQDLRAFGTEQLSTVDRVLNDRMQDLKDSITATLEYHRTGAVKGVIYDAGGDELLNLFDAAGVAQLKKAITLPTAESVKDNPIKKAIYDVKRNAKKYLSGFMIKRFECMCSPAFFDGLTGHALVREAYERWQAVQDRFGEDDRKGFTYGGVTFRTRSAASPWLKTARRISTPWDLACSVRSMPRPTGTRQSIPSACRSTPRRNRGLWARAGTWKYRATLYASATSRAPWPNFRWPDHVPDA